MTEIVPRSSGTDTADHWLNSTPHAPVCSGRNISDSLARYAHGSSIVEEQITITEELIVLPNLPDEDWAGLGIQDARANAEAYLRNAQQRLNLLRGDRAPSATVAAHALHQTAIRRARTVTVAAKVRCIFLADQERAIRGGDQRLVELYARAYCRNFAIELPSYDAAGHDSPSTRSAPKHLDDIDAEMSLAA